MSLVKEALESLAQKGKLEHDCTILGIKFVLEPLSTEEQILADGIVDVESLKKKYGATEDFNTYADTVGKYRTLAQLMFAVKKVNGASPVDLNASLQEQFKQRLEFRDELSNLSTTIIDELTINYRKLLNKQKDFFDNLEENVGKF